MNIIALCGMPGSGKSTVSKYAADSWGIPTYYAGQLLMDECAIRGLEPSYDNKMTLGEDLGLFCLDDPLKFLQAAYQDMRIRFPQSNLVIFDSLRSIAELKFLQARETVSLLGIVLDKDERYRRLRSRDQVTDKQIIDRDLLEVGCLEFYMRKLGVGSLLALSDFFILIPREDPFPEHFYTRLNFVFERIMGNLNLMIY